MSISSGPASAPFLCWSQNPPVSLLELLSLCTHLPSLLLQGLLQVCFPLFSSAQGAATAPPQSHCSCCCPGLCLVLSVLSSLLWLSHPLTVLIAFPNARLSSFSNFSCIIFEIDPIKFLPFSMSSPALKAKSFVASCS